MRRSEILHGDFSPIREKMPRHGDIFVAPRTPQSHHDVFRGKPPESPKGVSLSDKESVYHHPLFKHDRGRKIVYFGNEECILSPMLDRALTFFETKQNQVVTDEELVRRVAGDGYSSDYAKDIVHLVRKKVEPDPQNPSIIISVERQGYVFINQEIPFPQDAIYQHPGINGTPGYVHNNILGVVEVGGQRTQLTWIENELLSLLEANPNRLVTYATIAKKIWDVEDTSIVDIKSHMSHLLDKIEPNRKKGTSVLITTEMGLGYRLNDDSKEINASEQEESDEQDGWKYEHFSWKHYYEYRFVKIGEKRVRLTKIQNALLRVLEEASNSVLPKEDIDERLAALGIGRQIDINCHLTNLRKKVEPQHVKGKPEYVIPVVSIGWMLFDPAAPEKEPDWLYTHTGFDDYSGYSHDEKSRLVKVDGKKTRLTKMQNGILTLLEANADYTVSHSFCNNYVFDVLGHDRPRGLKDHISDLQMILDPKHTPGKPRLIVSVPGVGYRLVDPRKRRRHLDVGEEV